MSRLHFESWIRAPRERVWNTMLAPDTYRTWTTAFAEGSHYQGGWSKGDAIRFLSPEGDGIVSEIAESQPHELLSIRHLGEIRNGVEDRESASWGGNAYEIYRFSDENGGTRLNVEMDVTPEWEAMMNESWPKALEKLKALCEESRPNP